MGDAALELSKEQENAIGSYIRHHFSELVSDFQIGKGISEREMDIRERIVRVEESLDRQMKLM